MRHMSTTKKITTTFDFAKMSTSANNYNDDFVHPMHQELVFRAADGSEVKLFVGQIATLVALANQFPNAGKAIDHMFSGIPEEQRAAIALKY